MTGLIRGSKHWTFKMTQELWDWLSPLIRTALDKVSFETKFDWLSTFGACARARDPNRIHQLLAILMEDPVSSKSSMIGEGLICTPFGFVPQYKYFSKSK